MNQTTNLIQWKNLTDEEKAGFYFENYKYEFQHGLDWILKTNIDLPINGDSTNQCVYRLVIEPDKWYYCDWINVKSEVLKGLDLAAFNTVADIKTVRPATADEIPKPERVFKDGAFYPVIYQEAEMIGRYRRIAAVNRFWFGSDDYTYESKLTWIGEELKIKWGEG